MSNEIVGVFDSIREATKIEFPDGGGVETDSPLVEAALAVGIVGATVGVAAYGLYKLFGSDD